MAHIKCRYSIPYCTWQERYTRPYHSEFWWCDDNSQCPYNNYVMPKDSKAINGQCVFCKYSYGEFEKTVRNYEYCQNGDLKIGKTIYDGYDIEYLEIDGRVLIGETVEPQESEG